MKRLDPSSILKGREALLIMLLVIAVKLPLLCSHGNLFDRYAIEKDPVLDGRATTAEAFTGGSPLGSADARYRPSTTASLASDLRMDGGEMLFVRLANLLLDIGLMVLVYRLLLRFGVMPFPAAVALALLWLHPIQVAAIASMDGRAPLLGLTAYLLAFDLAGREAANWRHRLFAFVFALLGALASLQLWPLALLPLLAAWTHRRDLKTGWRRSLPMVAASALGVFLALFFHGHVGMAPEGRLVDGTGFFGGLRASFAVIGSSYVRILFSPTYPLADAPIPGAAQLGLPFALLGFFMVCAAFLFALKARRSGRGIVAFGLVLAPLLLLMTTPLAGTGPQPRAAEALPALIFLGFPLAGWLMIPFIDPGRKLRHFTALLLAVLAVFALLRAWPYREAELIRHSRSGDGPLAAIEEAYEAGRATEGALPARAAEREIIEAALTRFPGDPRLLVERLRVELRPSGDARLANDALHALLDDDRHIPGLTGLEGALHAAQGQRQLAEEAWRRGAEEEPIDAYSCYELALDSMRRGHFDLARGRLLSALRQLRGPAEQMLAAKVLLQLDYLRQRQEVETSFLRALAREQLRYAARAEDRRSIEALIERLPGAERAD